MDTMSSGSSGRRVMLPELSRSRFFLRMRMVKVGLYGERFEMRCGAIHLWS